MRLGNWVFSGRATDASWQLGLRRKGRQLGSLATLLISSRRTRDSKNLKSLLEELKDMSSGQIVGVLCRPITGLEELPALANSSPGHQNVGHLHMLIRVEGGPRLDPCPFTQRSQLFFEPRVPGSFEA